MNKDPNLDLLNNVKRMEAPPFLLTRVMAKIHSEVQRPVPASWKWAGGLAFVVLLALNTGVAQWQSQTVVTPVQSLVDNMALQPSNQLYDE